MVALVVVAIALGIGVPVFTTMAANERMSSATNDLVTSLHGARSEALMRQAPIALCPTPDGAGACVGGGNLALGWTVFVDRNGDGSLDADDVILQRHAALHPELVAAAGDRHIEFRFNLPQVRIERTGDIGEVVVVHVRSERQDLFRC